jgi:hypothetical protein
MGMADVVEVFSIYGQASGSDGKTAELSRALIRFPVNNISEARDKNNIPTSGSVEFYLRMFNAKHAFTTPSNFTLFVAPVSASWEEGHGLDMEEYRDVTKDGEGANWTNSATDTTWSVVGGDFDTEDLSFKADFDNGDEDLEVNITTLVEEWLSEHDASTGDQRANYGLALFLTGTQEAYFSSSNLSVDPSPADEGAATVNLTPDASGSSLHNVTGSTRSYYTKKFFSRGTEYFFKKPMIEARWESSLKDDRANFYASSSLATAEENLNTIYLYNVVKGQLRNIPDIGDGAIYVQIFDEEASGSVITPIESGSDDKQLVITSNYITGGLVPNNPGIYSASFALDTTASVVYDRWFSADNASPTSGNEVCYHTGTIVVKKIESEDYNPNLQYVTKVTNLKPSYSQSETARFRLFTREKGWCPNVYTKVKQTVSGSVIDEAYYKIYRVVDNLTVVDYGTGSNQETLLSYDMKGNYFDFDISMLAKGYSYGLKFAYRRDDVYHEQSESFKFRVE